MGFYNQGDPFYRGPARGFDASRVAPWQPNGMPTTPDQAQRFQDVTKKATGVNLGAPNYLDTRGGPEIGPANLRERGPMFTMGQYGPGRMDRYGMQATMGGTGMGMMGPQGGLTAPKFGQMFAGERPDRPGAFADFGAGQRGAGQRGLGWMEKLSLGVGAAGGAMDIIGSMQDRKREDEERERERERMAKWSEILGGAMGG